VDVADSRFWGKSLPSNSIHCVVTSPPYFGLRSYLPSGHPDKDKEIGLEKTPDEYISQLVEVFASLWDALHPSGVLWLNLGDSYNGSGKTGGCGKQETNEGSMTKPDNRGGYGGGLKEKDLIGIPWMTAFALRKAGWFLRQSCCWIKRSSMPESVEDRPSTSCETVFLLSKSSRYFFDMQAVRKSGVDWGSRDRSSAKTRRTPGQGAHRGLEGVESGRNMRSGDFWFDSVGMLLAGDLDCTDDDTILGIDVNPEPYKESHFAVMPTRLVLPMILAGTSEKGVCPHCGSPWVRVTEKERVATRPGEDTKTTGDSEAEGNRDPGRHVTVTRTVGWEPSCECADNVPVPAVVADPFTGSGTVLAVARRRNRHAVGCELNPDYMPLIKKRVGAVTPSLI
jgi:DNA modification methylase